MTEPRLQISPVLRVLVSTHTFLPVVGGAELGIHEIYSRVGTRHAVTIMTPLASTGLVTEYGGGDDYRPVNYSVVRLGARLRRIGTTASRAVRTTSLLYILELTRMRLRGLVDVVNFHFIGHHGLAVVFARRVLRLPTVVSLVGRNDVIALLPWYRRWYAMGVLRHASVIVPNSGYYTDGVNLRGACISTIPYGVDVREFSPNARSRELRASWGGDDRDVVLVAVQRLSSVKRVDVIIGALAGSVSRGASVRLVIVGKGPERHRLERVVASVGLEDRVTFADYVPATSLPAYFATADIFVSYSASETFGITLVQAMAAGLPIIAPDASAFPYVLSREHALLVPPADVDALADAIVSLASDDVTRGAMGRAARERAAREFTWDGVAAEYGALLERVSRMGRSRIAARRR